MKIAEAIVIRLKELCHEKKISYNALAHEAGLSPSTLKNILNGKSKNPGTRTLKIICDGLGVSIQDFFSSDIFTLLEQEID